MRLWEPQQRLCDACGLDATAHEADLLPCLQAEMPIFQYLYASGIIETTKGHHQLASRRHL